MNRRFWLSAAVAAIGASMLVFTAFAGAAPSAHAKKAER